MDLYSSFGENDLRIIIVEIFVSLKKARASILAENCAHNVAIAAPYPPIIGIKT
jgi:hypothetical protein